MSRAMKMNARTRRVPVGPWPMAAQSKSGLVLYTGTRVRRVLVWTGRLRVGVDHRRVRRLAAGDIQRSVVNVNVGSDKLGASRLSVVWRRRRAECAWWGTRPWFPARTPEVGMEQRGRRVEPSYRWRTGRKRKIVGHHPFICDQQC